MSIELNCASEPAASEDRQVSTEGYKVGIRECDEAFNELRRSLKNQTDPLIDTMLLEKAYQKAKELHGRTARLSGDLYLKHPLAVAQTLAKLHLSTSVIAAGLLHDTAEDCGYTLHQIRSDFSPNIAEIVDAVTALRKEDIDDPTLSTEDLHEKLDRLTDMKLVNSEHRMEAFLVRMADREHNLFTLEACPEHKRRKKAVQTTDFLLQIAKRLKMHYFDIVLGDLCEKYVNPDIYVKISSNRNAYLKSNGFAFSSFETQLNSAIKSQSYFTVPKSEPFSGNRATRRAVKTIEIISQMDPEAITGEFDKQDVWLNETVLKYPVNRKGDVVSNFLQMHSDWLALEQITLEYQGDTDGIFTFVLTDMFENNYCIKLIPDTEIYEYYVGRSADALTPLTENDATEECLMPKITVFSYVARKGKREFKRQLPSNATVLDLAFLVSPALASCVTAAQIRKDTDFQSTDYQYPLNTRLNEGDVVHFIADYGEDGKVKRQHAKVEWFAYIKTTAAQTCLIQLLKQ